MLSIAAYLILVVVLGSMSLSHAILFFGGFGGEVPFFPLLELQYENDWVMFTCWASNYLVSCLVFFC
jgi:hypothetical protein